MELSEKEKRDIFNETDCLHEAMQAAYHLGFKKGMAHQQAKTDPEFASVLNIIKTQETK